MYSTTYKIITNIKVKQENFVILRIGEKMQNLLVLIEPSEYAYETPLKVGNMTLNRFCIDEDTPSLFRHHTTTVALTSNN